jgi:tetratricopeptide (TPR) repeat protein
MGVVYRSDDLESGGLVALKLLHPNQRPDRFLREADVLAQLSHPAVVRYVAHGITATGQVYLAMEWLDAQSLSEILSERRLTFSETLTLLRRVASGLAVAHERSVVHRDLKPANILVPERTLGAAKLIDFGIARRRLDPRLTERGLLVGTLTYMSPEQARGSADVEPSSDVFSLGTMVYKCLTGETPFQGGDATAVLAKVLLEDPPELKDMAAGVSAEFSQLALRMLAKDPAVRPRDARVVLEMVEQLGDAAATENTNVGITSREQRVVWVALLSGGLVEITETLEAKPSDFDPDPESRLAASVAGFGGRYDVLADGTRVASFVGSGVPADEAIRAVRAAEAMGEIYPGRPLVVASGMGVLGGRAPVGDAIERGSELLAKARGGTVRLDAATARLVSASFEVASDDAGLYLAGTRREADATRKLLGRPTTCVGREQELETLEALLEECVSEPVSRVAIVTAPAGVGKSRLRYEFLRRVRELHPDASILLGRADAVSAGSPFSLLRQALRRSADIRDGEPAELAREKLVARIRTRTELEQTAVYLGELAGTPFPEDSLDTLRTTRENPTLLGDSMRTAWLSFLERECGRHPVLLVLEDLHWGDIPSVAFIDAALSALPEAPLFVFALARPEVNDVFPSLWSRREPQQIRLNRLRKSAAEALVREVLGGDVTPALVDRVVTLADGNAFFLEELIRAVSEGQSELPETVIGMMQARLEALGSEARRVLRAGSVFGDRFWHGGVRALVGGDAEDRFIAGELDELVRRELISGRPETTLAGETEYTFRHATLQETVYATLTLEDKALGHRLAGEWLESVGSTDALALAEHFQRGGVKARAARWYLEAAGKALEGTDLPATIERVGRALECDPDPATQGALHHLGSDAHFWRGEYADSERHALAAVELLPEGEPRWFLAVGALCSAAGTLGHDGDLTAWAERAIRAPARSEETRAAKISCVVRASHGQLKVGRYDMADVLIDLGDELTRELTTLRDFGLAWSHHGKSARAYYKGDLGAFLREIESAIVHFDAVGDARAGANARANLGYAALSVGDLDRAEQLLREANKLTDRLGMGGINHYVLHNLGLVLAYSGKLAEGQELERRAVELAEMHNETLLIGGAHLYLAIILLLSGDAQGAEAEARIAEKASAKIPMLLSQALAVRSGSLLTRGQLDEALVLARQASATLVGEGSSDEAEGRVRVALVDALVANGLLEEAKTEAEKAVAYLQERASRLGDERIANAFLTRLPEHARLIAHHARLSPQPE